MSRDDTYTPPGKSMYADLIAEMVGDPSIDPRHVEAYIRLEYPVMSHLTRETLRREVRIGVACVRDEGAEVAEECARSFGL